MELLVIRHAIAEPHGMGKVDAERALTDRGRKRFSDVVQRLHQVNLTMNAVLTSPWLRAAQTAEMLQPLCAAPPQATDALAQSPGDPLLAALRGTDGEAVGIVGHEPWMSETVAWLVLGDRALSHGFVFKKGGVAWLEGEPRPGAMTLKAFMPPRTLR